MNERENKMRINQLYNLLWDCIEQLGENEFSYAEVIGILEVIKQELIQQSKEPDGQI